MLQPHRVLKGVEHDHAVLTVSPYLRSTSRALRPFLPEQGSTMTKTHVRKGTRVPLKIVPVRTENCLGHPTHFQTRRRETLPVRVARPVPFAGLRK